MTPIRLAISELRRLTAGKLLRLALAALILVPSLYAGLYLWANKDPYAALPSVPAAVVSEDAGTTLSTGERLQVGGQVADHLVESHTFDWHHVNRSQALQGVHDGRYTFALILPTNFSADLASSAEFTPRQASLILETNDANNYMTSLIGNTVVKDVSRAVATEVTQTAASKLLLGFTTIHSQLGEAVDASGRLADGASTAATGAARLADGAGTLAGGLHDLSAGAARLSAGVGRAASGADRLASGSGQLAVGLGTLDTKVSGLPVQTRALADGAAQVAEGNQQVAVQAAKVAAAATTLQSNLAGGKTATLDALAQRGLTDAQIAIVAAELDRLDAAAATATTSMQRAASDLARLAVGSARVAAGSQRLADAMPALTSSVHRAATGASALHSGAQSLAGGLGQLETGAGQLASGAAQASTGADRLDQGATSLAAGLDRLRGGATQLHDGLVTARASVPNSSEAQRRAVAETLGNPLKVQAASMSRAGSYGAGLAPLFITLGLWIGAYTLFLLVQPYSSRAVATNQRALRTALGGWLAPAAVGVVQVGAVLAVVRLLVDIHVAHPGLALLFLIAVSATFVAILQALSARFGAPGKFAGLVLMVVQLVSSGGTFPWQTLPAPLQAVHHLMPMSYAIDGLRRLMYGADLGPVLGDLGVLAAYLVVALVVSAAATRRARVWTPVRIKPDLRI